MQTWHIAAGAICVDVQVRNEVQFINWYVEDGSWCLPVNENRLLSIISCKYNG